MGPKPPDLTKSWSCRTDGTMGLPKQHRSCGSSLGSILRMFNAGGILHSHVLCLSIHLPMLYPFIHDHLFWLYKQYSSCCVFLFLKQVWDFFREALEVMCGEPANDWCVGGHQGQARPGRLDLRQINSLLWHRWFIYKWFPFWIFWLLDYKW